MMYLSCPPAQGAYADQSQSSIVYSIDIEAQPLGHKADGWGFPIFYCKHADMYLETEGLFNVIIRCVFFFYGRSKIFWNR